jgi:microcystin-dependent protein
MDLFNKLKTHKEIFLIVILLLIPLYINYFNLKSYDIIKGNTTKLNMVGSEPVLNTTIETPNFLVSDASGSITTFIIPKGTIVMFNKGSADIPIGWAMCDGTNGTPDLRGRFVLGSNPENNKNGRLKTNSMSTTGGIETKFLSVSEMPVHTHTFSQAARNAVNGQAGAYNSADNYMQNLKYSTENTGTAGGTTGFDMRPPYYVLTYIMKII